MTRWRLGTLSIGAPLYLVLDSDDPVEILKVEASATAQGMALVRIQDDESTPDLGVATDYAESAE